MSPEHNTTEFSRCQTQLMKRLKRIKQLCSPHWWLQESNQLQSQQVKIQSSLQRIPNSLFVLVST